MDCFTEVSDLTPFSISFKRAFCSAVLNASSSALSFSKFSFDPYFPMFCSDFKAALHKNWCAESYINHLMIFKYRIYNLPLHDVIAAYYRYRKVEELCKTKGHRSQWQSKGMYSLGNRGEYGRHQTRKAGVKGKRDGGLSLHLHFSNVRAFRLNL
jgi:tRNA(His) 5'-end guanylyltransferase